MPSMSCHADVTIWQALASICIRQGTSEVSTHIHHDLFIVSCYVYSTGHIHPVLDELESQPARLPTLSDGKSIS